VGENVFDRCVVGLVVPVVVVRSVVEPVEPVNKIVVVVVLEKMDELVAEEEVVNTIDDDDDDDDDAVPQTVRLDLAILYPIKKSPSMLATNCPPFV
jgi:hypothetical protein